MTGKICGTGSCVPREILDNDMLSHMVETSDEWIRERTGIRRRHIAKEETTAEMAAEAARRALQDAEIPPELVDMILVATVSANAVLPCTACQVQSMIGAEHAVCYDLNAACSGFIFALHTAQAYIASGMYRTILIIGAETLSRLVDYKDRSTCILFGDGAGAAVVQASITGFYKGIMRSLGDKGKYLVCGEYRERPDLQSIQADHIEMNGQEIFKFAVRQVPAAVERLLALCGTSLEDLDMILLHQANRRIVEAVARRMNADIGLFPMNLQEYGNTSAASIPILLDEINRKGALKRGMRIVLAGFGAGLSLGASMLTW